MAAHINERYSQVQGMLQSGSIDDFNLHTIQHQEVPASSASTSTTTTTSSDQSFSHLCSFAGLFFVSTFAISSLLISKSLHTESVKLHDLNRIYKNEHARVADGKNKDKMLRWIQEYKDIAGSEEEEDSDKSENENGSNDDEEEAQHEVKKMLEEKKRSSKKKSKKSKEMKNAYVPPEIDLFAQQNKQHTETKNVNMLNYSLYDIGSPVEIQTHSHQNLSQMSYPNMQQPYPPSLSNMTNPLGGQHNLHQYPPTSMPMVYPNITPLPVPKMHVSKGSKN